MKKLILVVLLIAVPLATIPVYSSSPEISWEHTYLSIDGVSPAPDYVNVLPGDSRTIYVSPGRPSLRFLWRICHSVWDSLGNAMGDYLGQQLEQAWGTGSNNKLMFILILC